VAGFAGDEFEAALERAERAGAGELALREKADGIALFERADDRRMASSGWSRRMVIVSKMVVKMRIERRFMKTSSMTKRSGRGLAAERKNASA
jgi:hypothetical protein